MLTASLAMAVLSACSAIAPREERSIVDEVRAIQQMSGETLLAEEARLAKSDGPRERLLRAALLAAPGHPMRDVAAAQQALAREAKEAAERRRPQEAPPQWSELAGALALWLGEQQRADGLQQQQLGDDRRLGQLDARARDLERRLQESERRAIETERRAQEAERKLEALRAIEKEMSGRAPETR